MIGTFSKSALFHATLAFIGLLFTFKGAPSPRSPEAHTSTETEI